MPCYGFIPECLVSSMKCCKRLNVVDVLFLQCHSVLLPQLLEAGIEVLSDGPALGNSASAAVGFITAITMSMTKSSDGIQIMQTVYLIFNHHSHCM